MDDRKFVVSLIVIGLLCVCFSVIVPDSAKASDYSTTFGYTTEGTSTSDLGRYGAYGCTGANFVSPINGTVTEIVFAVVNGGVSVTGRGAIYVNSSKALIGLSDNVTIPINKKGWVYCTSSIRVYKGTQYLIAADATANYPTTTISINYSSVSGYWYSRDTTLNTIGYADPWVSDSSGNGREYSIYVTVKNCEPTFSSEYPVNESTGVSASPTCRINVSDCIGDRMTVTWFTNHTGSWVNEQQNVSVLNGTLRYVFIHASGVGVTYYWKVSCNDGLNNVSAVYHFTIFGTPWSNRAPVITVVGPGNGTTGISRWNRTSVTVSDLDGNSTTVSFWSNHTGSWVCYQVNLSVPANTTVRDMNTSYAHDYNTKIYWKVYAEDEFINVSKWFYFTIIPAVIPFDVDTVGATGVTNINATLNGLLYVNTTGTGWFDCYVNETESSASYGSNFSLKWSVSGLDFEAFTTPLARDVNDDGYMELFIEGYSTTILYGRLYCFSGLDGSVLWSKTVYQDYHIGMALADVNKDGSFELVYAGKPSGNTYNLSCCYADNGTLLWSNNVIGPEYHQFCVADTDYNGYPYVYIVRSGDNAPNPKPINGRIYKIWGTNGTVKSTSDIWEYHCSYGGVAVGDTDLDGDCEVYCSDRDGSQTYGTATGVHAFNDDLELEWNVTVYGQLCSSHAPLLVNVTGDAQLEIVVCPQGIGTGGIRVIYSNGTVVSGKSTANLGLGCHAQPLVYDFDDDGNIELVTSYATPIKVFDLDSWALEGNITDNTPTEPADVGNIAGDNSMELIGYMLGGTHKGVFFYNSTYDEIGSVMTSSAFGGLIQDIDTDDLNEIVVYTKNIVYCYETQGHALVPRPRTDDGYYSNRRNGASSYVPVESLHRKLGLSYGAFSLNLFGLTPGELYCFKAYANSSYDESVNGSNLYFITKPNDPVITSNGSYDNTVIVGWSASHGADRYLIERNNVSIWTRGSGTVVFNDSICSFSEVYSGASTTLYYHIWSFCEEDGYSQFSSSYDSIVIPVPGDPYVPPTNETNTSVVAGLDSAIMGGLLGGFVAFMVGMLVFGREFA